MLSHCACNRLQRGVALETGGSGHLCGDVQGTCHRRGHRDLHARSGTRRAGEKTGILGTTPLQTSVCIFPG